MIIAMDTSLVASKGVDSSILMFVDMWNVPANGTYTLHSATGLVPAPTPDGWESDGFITVNVVD